jgi:LysM repeat protein
MNRRQLAFVIAVNALVSLVIALMVAWIVDLRRPDLEELAARFTPAPLAVMAATPTLAGSEPAAQDSVAPAETPAVAAPTGPTPGETELYIVQVGDSLLGIALRYNISIEDIVAANELTNPDFVFSGQRLNIPIGGISEPTVTVPTQSSPTQASAGVQIAAVENSGDPAAEAVLIVNESDSPLNLQNWQLSGEGGTAYIFGNLPLFAGSSIRVFTGVGSDNSVALYWGQSAPIWAQGAEVRLVDGERELVDSFVVP